jgi:hypothetical protein
MTNRREIAVQTSSRTVSQTSQTALSLATGPASVLDRYLRVRSVAHAGQARITRGRILRFASLPSYGIGEDRVAGEENDAVTCERDEYPVPGTRGHHQAAFVACRPISALLITSFRHDRTLDESSYMSWSNTLDTLGFFVSQSCLVRLPLRQNPFFAQRYKLVTMSDRTL